DGAAPRFAPELVGGGDVDADVGEGEGRVGQAVAEGEGDGLVEGIVVAIADEAAFAVDDVAVLVSEVQIGRGVLEAQGHSFVEFAGSGGVAEQQIGGSGTAGLSAEPQVEDCIDLVEPGCHRHDGSVG